MIDDDKLKDLLGFEAKPKKKKNKFPKSRNPKINKALRQLEAGCHQVKVRNIKPNGIHKLRNLERYGLELYYDQEKKTLFLERNRQNSII